MKNKYQNIRFYILAPGQTEECLGGLVCVGAGAGERMAGAKVPSLSPQSQGGPGSNKSDSGQ